MNWTSSDDAMSSNLDRGSATINITRECLDNLTVKTTVICVMSICVLPAFFGNALVIISYIRFRYFHGKAMYRFIVNMAVSDLLIGFAMLLYPLSDIFPEIKRYKYFCISRFVLVLLSMGSSVLFLTLISIDRFLAIVFPLTHRVKSQSKRRAWTIVIVTWILSLLISSSQFLDNNLDGYGAYDKDMPCWNTAIMSSSFYAVADAVIVIVLFLDLILYVFVLRAICKSAVTKNCPGSAVARTKLMIIVHVTFVVCWLPLLIGDFVFIENEDNVNTITICVREFLFLLGVIQSCTNWIYYGIWNKNFRKAFVTMLCCCRRVDDNAVGSVST